MITAGLDNPTKSDRIDITRDETFRVKPSEERLLKRLRQLGNGAVQIVLLDGEIFLLIVDNQIEIISRFQKPR